MKKRSNRTVHAPQTLEERELEGIGGGVIIPVQDPLQLLLLQQQQQIISNLG
jgi:hypothetical protein